MRLPLQAEPGKSEQVIKARLDDRLQGMIPALTSSPKLSALSVGM
jgi:hypothetical protein